MEAYQPIPCMTHERLEFAVLRRLRLDLAWIEDGVEAREVVRPLDVATREGAEWLKIQRDRGEPEWLRLDRILSFTEM